MAVGKRKCKSCGEYVREFIVTPKGVFCDYDSATKWAYANKSKGAEIVRKAQKKKDTIRKKELKSVGDYVKEAQAAVNKYIRLRDRNKPCVSCGSNPSDSNLMTGSRFDAGHYRSRGSAGHLRFNLLNIHKQCVKCNRFNSGNAVDYRIELINRIGQDNVDKLESDNKTRKFTVEYLERVKRVFNKRARFYDKRSQND